jgi:hypothetical protein
MTTPMPAGSARQSATELGENLSLVARWFYSNPRDGEIFFREKDWPYRRILRACSRLLMPKKDEPEKSSKIEEQSKSEGAK